MIEEHDVVALTQALPKSPFVAGDCGVVVHIYPGAVAYELEFFSGSGQSIGIHTASSTFVRPLSSREVSHVREFVAV